MNRPSCTMQMVLHPRNSTSLTHIGPDTDGLRELEYLDTLQRVSNLLPCASDPRLFEIFLTPFEPRLDVSHRMAWSGAMGTKGTGERKLLRAFFHCRAD